MENGIERTNDEYVECMLFVRINNTSHHFGQHRNLTWITHVSVYIFIGLIFLYFRVSHRFLISNRQKKNINNNNVENRQEKKRTKNNIYLQFSYRLVSRFISICLKSWLGSAILFDFTLDLCY